jgi:hypothetical protein
MEFRLAAFAVIITLALAVASQADSVVLRSGEVHTGRVVNRDEVRRSPDSQSHISIYSQGTSTPLRFSLSQVHHLVFEDDGYQEVVDVKWVEPEPPDKEVPSSRRTLRRYQRTSELTPRRRGMPLIVCGLGTTALGALVKFGGEKAVVTEHSATYDENSYNAANYILVVAGGAMVVAGIVIWSQPDGGGSSHAELSLEPSATPLSRAPAVACWLRF